MKKVTTEQQRTHAVAYVRVSTEEQAREGISLDAQEAKIRAYCELAGLEIVAMVRDEGVSGGKVLASRPGGEQVLDLLERGKAGHVVALKLDRLFRDTVDALNQTKAWDRAGVALHLVDLGGQTLNTSSAMGRFFLSVMAGTAELERNLIAERTATALSHKKANRQAYSPTPFGYVRDGDALVQDEAEQGIIRQIVGWRRERQTLAQIASNLNAANVPTKRGRSQGWYPATVAYILNNQLYHSITT